MQINALPALFYRGSDAIFAALQSERPYNAPHLPEPTVVFEDNHLLVLDKPAGMPVQGDESGDLCLVDWAKAYLVAKYQKPGEAFVGLVHRLDRPVGGLVMLAKTSKALARLNAAVADRSITKRYLARTEHMPDAPSGVLEDYLLKNAANNTSRRVSPKHKQGKRAVLGYQVFATDGQAALLGVDLQTGRHHQIRVQLASRGWAIVGDVKYGARQHYSPQAIQLHASYLRMAHPVGGAILELYSAPPWSENSSEMLKKLGEWLPTL